MDDFDDDFGVDFEDIPAEETLSGEKPSLKEIWDTNPILKLVAGILAVAVVGILVTVFMPESEEQSKAILAVGGGATVTHIPGQEELDPAYKKALEESNKRAAEEALRSGGSALPTPVGVSKTESLNVDQMPQKPKADPLAEWRKATETRRRDVDAVMPQEEAGGLEPEVVPMVQPIRPKQAQTKRDPEAVKVLAEQMRVIVAAQKPADLNQSIITFRQSPYIRQLEEKAAKDKQGSALAGAGSSNTTVGVGEYDHFSGGKDDGQTAMREKVIIPAGTVSYAQVANELNSDVPGPVLAEILSGPFAGGRAIGEFSVENEYMVLTFKRIVKDAVSYTVDAVAMDEKTTLTGMATDVDSHYIKRIILPAAAKFIEGYSSARGERSTTTTTGAGGETVTDKPKATTKEATNEGIAEAGKVLAKIVEEDGDLPVTVKVARGTTFGVLFLEAVTTGSVE